MIPISELNLTKIGEIVKTHGYKGEMTVKLNVDFNRLKKTELIFVLIDGNKVPFFFSYPPKPHKKSLMLIKPDGIESDEDAERLIGSEIFIESGNLSESEEETGFIPEGYDVFDKDTFIGKSGTYLNIPSNPILTVISENNKEILIPFNDFFLKQIDRENKKIIFDLPEGLIELNF